LLIILPVFARQKLIKNNMNQVNMIKEKSLALEMETMIKVAESKSYKIIEYLETPV
jgi:hypothetical protein